ncbi:hypothetical protein TRSC58_00373 [Trypanosoma rangeli SC58]|uniref:Uncharacterized protein n=1 Tax=Trypanosoma rangeli SC58 TaxID=429131 RepID=A0A061J8W1_TRYRA|nr:hypothetical protein TRSC58_00373 [Trypanosoma rangeli SC58]
MTLFTDEALDELLRENRRLQSHVRSLLGRIGAQLVLADTLLLSLRYRELEKRQGNRNEPLGADLDTWFSFRCGSQVCAPALRMQPPPYCQGLSPKFRWSHRATRSMKRQVERLGLDTGEVGDPAQWQVVADAVNYDSKSTQCIDSFQCFLHYQQEVVVSPEPFSSAEDNYIDAYIPGTGRWGQLVADILRQFGRRRTVFQVAERYRKLKREMYEYSGLLDVATWQKVEALMRGVATPEAELVLDCSCRLNLGCTIPWPTEEAIRKSFLWHRKPQRNGDALMLRNIYAVLLSDGVYFASRETREIAVRLLGFEPLDLRETIARVRWRYGQISVEEAAARLASSVDEMKERVLAKVLRWYDSVYTSDFFRLSVAVFGQRDAALTCFRIAREYERCRGKAPLYGRLQLL